MNEADRYSKLVEWSDEDGCFIGSCPELFHGGCHGDDPRAVFDELCQIIMETVDLYRQDGRPLPKALSGRQVASVLQGVA